MVFEFQFPKFGSKRICVGQFLPSGTKLLWDRILHYIGAYTSVCSLKLILIFLYFVVGIGYSVRNISSITGACWSEKIVQMPR
jgi:hypothetical protein